MGTDLHQTRSPHALPHYIPSFPSLHAAGGTIFGLPFFLTSRTLNAATSDNRNDSADYYACDDDHTVVTVLCSFGPDRSELE